MIINEVVVGAVLLGAILGALKAKKRGGNLADKLQYGAVLAIFFGILAVFANVMIYRVVL